MNRYRQLWFVALVASGLWIGCSGEDVVDEGPAVDVPLDPTIRPDDGALMVLIEAGTFMMGDPNAVPGADNRPAHVVYLSDFYIDETEVTDARYRAFMEATGHSPPAFWDDPALNRPEQPVVGVTWHDAEAYARWAGKRLPTEAEWEKAARGGLSGQLYPWGGGPPDSARAVFGGATAPSDVRVTAPNAFGLYDMAGNVWEWCADYYDATYYANSAETDPRGPLFGVTRVVRGGSYLSDATSLAVAARSHLSPEASSAVTGFRCVRSPF